MVFTLFTDILIIFAIALIVGMLFNRIRVPPLVAFILTGVIVGPYGFSIIKGQEQVTSIAEIGIILLLFTIGLEFSFKSLWKIRLIAVIGGALQVGLSFAFFCGLYLLLGRPAGEAILMGFLFSLSSTAIGTENSSPERRDGFPAWQYRAGYPHLPGSYGNSHDHGNTLPCESFHF